MEKALLWLLLLLCAGAVDVWVEELLLDKELFRVLLLDTEMYQPQLLCNETLYTWRVSHARPYIFPISSTSTDSDTLHRTIINIYSSIAGHALVIGVSDDKRTHDWLPDSLIPHCCISNKHHSTLVNVLDEFPDLSLPVANNQHSIELDDSSCQEFDPEKDDIFLEMDEHAVLSVSHLFKASLQNAMASIAPDVATSVSSGLMGPIQASMDQNTIPGMANDLISRLSSSIPHQLSTLLVPSLMASLGSTISETMGTALADKVTEILTPKLEEDIVTRLNKSLAETLPEAIAVRINDDLVHSVGEAVPFITKLVGHSVTGALTHTLSHSPMHDYYCYYCYHRKMYCSYCQFSPSQAHHSLYVAGYASSYLADYYSKHMTEVYGSVNSKRKDHLRTFETVAVS